MKYTERQTFKTSIIQKQILKILHQKYKINTSQFIRDAINEKIERENELILNEYKEFYVYINKLNNCPF